MLPMLATLLSILPMSVPPSMPMLAGGYMDRQSVHKSVFAPLPAAAATRARTTLSMSSNSASAASAALPDPTPATPFLSPPGPPGVTAALLAACNSCSPLEGLLACKEGGGGVVVVRLQQPQEGRGGCPPGVLSWRTEAVITEITDRSCG